MKCFPCGSISRNKYPDFPHIPEKRSPYRMHYQNASEQMFPPENDQRTALLLAYNLFPNGDQLETSRDRSDLRVGRSRQARRNKHFPLP